jgi:hypothetical protein
MVTAREPPNNSGDSVETTRRRLPRVTKAYLLGIIHDATQRKTTFRLAQKNRIFIDFLAGGIRSLGSGAWIYKEGKNRNLWVVEFSKSLLKGTKISSGQDKIDYVRGYFDAEGGMAQTNKVRFYLYFAQKDYQNLKEVKDYLEELGINCGKIHNPSKKADPDYWRFYIRAKSYRDFARIIDSCHPEKSRLLRMKR